MKGFINKTVRLFLRSKYQALKQVIEDPHHYQNKLFKRLIDKARHTGWGRKYQYDDLPDYAAYRHRVPISAYEDIQPFIERMMKGEKDVLWPGNITWFSKSSGTTGTRSKFIPVSEDNFSECHKKGSWDTISILYHNNPDLKLFERKSLILGGSLSHYAPHPESIIGDVSAIMIANMPLIGRPFYVPEVKVAIMEDWQEKLELTASLTIHEEDIATIGGVPTWNLVLFHKILEKTGADHMLEVWPHLQLYIHGGVNFAPYRAQFEKLIPREDFLYQEVYNASEGYFGTQLTAGGDMILLLDNGIFYEFIPLKDYGKNDVEPVPLEGVVEGDIYVIVISTSSGLWRYEIGDTIQFTNTQPYTFRITGRTQQFINAFGEEVMIHNTDTAVARTAQKTGSEIRDYTVAPFYLKDGERGRHDWLIEFHRHPADQEEFARILDLELQNLNSDYAAKRTHDLALERLNIQVVGDGTFGRWLKYKNRQGSQVKVPRLANDRRYMDDILDFVRQSKKSPEDVK